MSDYLISRYNAKVDAALERREKSVAEATQRWNEDLGEAVEKWQTETYAAAQELTVAMEHRNRFYVEGPGSSGGPTEATKEQAAEPGVVESAPVTAEDEGAGDAELNSVVDAESNIAR